MNLTNQPGTCRQCGAPISARTLEGFCPGCMARLTFSVTTATTSGPEPACLWEFGDYELLEEIGRGAMGVVYKARQRSLDRVVAIKMILAGRFASRPEVERFKAEAQSAAGLRHPNIVAIHEIGEVEGQPYFTMEFVEGRSLAEVNRELGFTILDFRRAARWVRALAQAMQSAHERGVLHRDLKPSNVIIDRHDQPRITDFGLAKRLNDASDLTISGKAIGSPSFMPPEQALGRRAAIGPASDVYALGAVLYFLLTGRAPFAGETVEATLAQVSERDPVPPRKLNPGLPADLETICLKCLEKDPARRYATAAGLADELGRFLKDEPILARPISAPEKVWRWGRRNPRVAVLTASLLAVFLAGLSGIVWQWRRAERHAQNESEQRRRLEEALAFKEMENAEEMFLAGDAPSALARLAAVLRQSPTNRLAATRLLSALTWRNFSLPAVAPLTHRGAVLSAQFSRDGQRVVTASEDHTAAIWDAHTGERLARLPHADTVRHAEFSPDGRYVGTASEDGTARVWDAGTGQPVTPPLRHAKKVRRIHFSPDSSLVVTASADATARVWNSRTGELAIPPLHHGEYVDDADFSPDGSRIATASDDRTVCVWDARTGERLLGPMSHENSLWSVRFSPDGTRIISASSDQTARVWDAADGQLLFRLTHAALVNFASFSPDGTKIVTASWDDTARVWDARTGTAITPPLEFDSDVLYAEFSSDGQRVFTIADEAARVWDATTGAPLTELLVHDAPLRHLGGFSPDGGRVVTTSLDKTAIIWDVRPGAARPSVFTGLEASQAVSCSPDGRWLAAARGRETTAHIWEASTGKIVAGPLEHDGAVVTTQFSPDGQHLLTASRDGSVRIWNVPSGALQFQTTPPQGPLNNARFSPDGRRIISASLDKTAHIWNAANGEALLTPLRHGEYVQWAEFSPDSRKIVTASGDHTAQIWDATTGQPAGPPLRHELGLQCARFSADGKFVVTASEDGTARIWQVGNGQPVGRPLLHRGHVRWAEFSPDGRWVATTSFDRTARVWDAATGEPVTEPLKHPGSVRLAQFSPDSGRLVTVDLQPVIRIRDATTGHPLFEPLRHEAKVEAAVFLPGGNWLATAGGERRLRLWNVPEAPLPVPAWLPALAEAVAGKRLDSRGRSVLVNAEELVRLRQQLATNNATNFYARWSRWFFADRDTRTPSPNSL